MKTKILSLLFVVAFAFSCNSDDNSVESAKSKSLQPNQNNNIALKPVQVYVYNTNGNIIASKRYTNFTVFYNIINKKSSGKPAKVKIINYNSGLNNTTVYFGYKKNNSDVDEIITFNSINSKRIEIRNLVNANENENFSLLFTK